MAAMYGFRKKLTVLMLVLVTMAMLMTGLPGIYFAREKVRNDAIRQIGQDTRLIVNHFEYYTNDLKESSMALEAAFLSSFDPRVDFKNEAALNQFKTGFLPQIREILHLMRPMSLWIVFNTEHVEGKHTLVFYDEERKGLYKRGEEYSIMDKDLSHPSMEWWSKAIEKGEAWTSPYLWPPRNMEVISYSKAIYIDSVLVACLGSDLDFNYLPKRLDTLHCFETGQLLLLNEKNVLIYSGNNSDSPPPLTQSLVSATTESPTDFITYKFGKANYIGSRQKLNNGWTIALWVPQNEIFSEVNQLIFELVVICIIVFFIALILALYLSKYITTPVKSLLGKFRRASDGDLSARANIRSNDEMQELADHFNQMMNYLQRSFNELEIAQKRLTREKERVQESDRLKSSFLENLSHEVRTPLMAIVGFSELMSDPGSTTEERHSFFSHIASNSNLLIRFIEDTLLFAQLEKGQAPVKLIPIKVADVLQDLKEEFEARRIKEKPHLFFRTLSDDCDMSLKTDPSLLRRIIRYLLDNAFKFTDTGGITIVCRKTDHHFEIIVSDSGIGISDDKTHIVFQKFCKVSESRDRVYDGAGIGLTNARSIALLLNGTIELSSTRGKGTTVTVSFPIFHP